MTKRDALASAIAAALDRWCMEPFIWGEGDCLLSLSDIIRDARGYDPAAQFRGRYSTPRGAARVTRAFGGFAGALQSMAEQRGWREIAPAQAFVGDVGILKGARGPRCGVICHGRLWVGRAMNGFAALPADAVATAWRVR